MDLKAISYVVDTGHAAWISESDWHELLGQSARLKAYIDRARQAGRDAADIWDELWPINRVLRAPNLKVRGIDDPFPTRIRSV